MYGYFIIVSNGHPYAQKCIDEKPNVLDEKKQMLEFADEHLYRLLNEMTAATLLACCSLRDRTNLLLEF